MTPTSGDLVKHLLLVHICHSICPASVPPSPRLTVHVLFGKAALPDSQPLQGCYQLPGWALPPTQSVTRVGHGGTRSPTGRESPRCCVAKLCGASPELGLHASELLRTELTHQRVSHGHTSPRGLEGRWGAEAPSRI